MLTFVCHCDYTSFYFPVVQLGEHGSLLSSQTPLYQFAQSAVPLVQPQALSYSTVSTHLTPPEMTTFPHPPKTVHTGKSLVAVDPLLFHLRSCINILYLSRLLTLDLSSDTVNVPCCTHFYRSVPNPSFSL